MSDDFPYPQSGEQFKPNSTTAIISLISGILGLTLLPIAGSIVAIITGYMARSEIRDSRGNLGGSGLATAGIILGYVGVALLLLALCLVGAFMLSIPFLMLGVRVINFSGLVLPPLLLAG